MYNGGEGGGGDDDGPAFYVFVTFRPLFPFFPPRDEASHSHELFPYNYSAAADFPFSFLPYYGIITWQGIAMAP